MLTHLCGVAHLHVNRPLNLSSHQWNPKVMVQYIGRHWNCFLSSNGKDGHELKLETAGPTFSSFNAIPAKITPPPPPWKKFSFNALWWTLFETLFTIIQQHFSYRGYYTVPQRYEFYFREAKTIFYSLAHEFYFRVAKRAQRVSKTLFLPRENKIHIFKPPCSVLFIM